MNGRCMDGASAVVLEIGRKVECRVVLDRAGPWQVQTTAPKRYLVKPNNGVLEAGASVKLQIHLQPKGRL